LARIANGTHDYLRLERGDEVILSSRIIPGNELSVLDLINRLEREGIRVWHRGLSPGLHASGHACREEQRRVLELTRPRSFLPIHGTFHHLNLHAELARETGVSEALVVENGVVLEIDPEAVRVAGGARCGRVHVQKGNPVAVSVLAERKTLGQVGMAVVVLPVDEAGGLTGEPRLAVRGVLDAEENRLALEQAGERVSEALSRLSLPAGEQSIRDAARRAVRSFFRGALGFKPHVEAIVVRA
jgi:ribonuclease J